MTQPSSDYASRVEEYKQRLEKLLVDAQGALERQAPDVLDKLAASARNIAQRLDEMARDARQRTKEKEAVPPEPAGASSEPAQGPKSPEEPHPDEPRGGGETLS